MVGEHRLGKQLQDFKSWEVKHILVILPSPPPPPFMALFTFFLSLPSQGLHLSPLLFLTFRLTAASPEPRLLPMAKARKVP